MRRGYADTAFGQVHYAEAGSGPALVLLPGAGQSYRLFAQLIAQLAQRYRVIAFDTLGTSYSAPLPAAFAFHDLAACIVQALDHLRIERARLYGIHSGNKIGAAVAANWPDLVESFIFVGQSHSIVVDRAARNAHILDITRHYFSPDAAAPDLRATVKWAEALRRVTDIGWEFDTRFGVRDAAAQFADNRTRIVDMLLAYDSGKAMYEANFAYDMEADLRRLACRTLIVEIATPGEDAAIGRQGDSLLKVIPRSALVTFEEPNGLGLTLDNRAAELSRAIVDFIG